MNKDKFQLNNLYSIYNLRSSDNLINWLIIQSKLISSITSSMRWYICSNSINVWLHKANRDRLTFLLIVQSRWVPIIILLVLLCKSEYHSPNYPIRSQRHRFSPASGHPFPRSGISRSRRFGRINRRGIFMTGNVEVLSGWEWVCRFPLTSFGQRFAPSLSVPSACCQGARDYCFTYGGSCCCCKSIAFQRHELGRGSRCPPPTRREKLLARHFNSHGQCTSSMLYFWMLAKVLRSKAYDGFLRHVFQRKF